MSATFPNVACVGMHFRGTAAVETAAALMPGDHVRLEREPENPYDAYAIRVMLEDMHIGYIERGQAAWISPRIDDGAEPEAVVTRLEQRGKNVHPILDITLHEPELA